MDVVRGDRPERAEGRVAVAAALVAALLVLAGAVGGLWLFRGDERGAPHQPAAVPSEPVVLPTATVDAGVLRVQALDELLGARGSAVLAHDRAAWLETVHPDAGEFVDRQAAVFDNLAEVPLREWRYEYAGEGPVLSTQRQAELGPDAWVARVVLVYRFAGASDLGEVRREQHLTLAQHGDGWRVAGDADGPSAQDLWDLGRVEVVRGERSLVLGTAEVEALNQYAAETDDAARHVDAVWGTEWPRTVVVLVPTTQTELAQVLGREDEAGLEQIAAVTTGEVRPRGEEASADRVIINPAGFAQLGPLGRQVVLTHEITHVATRATARSDVPIWLSEGFADYIAYRDAGVSRTVVAQDLLDEVRAGQVPSALPGTADFDPRQGVVASAYSGAWLAAQLVAERWGEGVLVSLYRSVASGTPVDEALVSHVELDEASFTEEWIGYVEGIAS